MAHGPVIETRPTYHCVDVVGIEVLPLARRGVPVSDMWRIPARRSM